MSKARRRRLLVALCVARQATRQLTPTRPIGQHAVISDEWLAAFAEGWSRTKPAAFIEFFIPLIEQDAVFTQPLARTARGHAAIERMFRRLFTVFPDFMLSPHGATVTADVVTIRSMCTVTAGSRRLRFPVQDRLFLRDGRISRREASFSVFPLLGSTLISPKTWVRLLNVQLPIPRSRAT